jgi:hypothetical protein
MKQLNNSARRTVSALFAVLTLTLILSAAAQAQSVTPILECITPDETSPGRTWVYFGYKSTFSYAVTYLPGTSNNFFSPIPVDRGQPSRFSPGEHRAVFRISINQSTTPELKYTLNGNFVLVTPDSPQCRTGTITYQGRLTTGGAQASGNYDLQFQLFDAATGGNAVSPLVSAASVAVSNGVFTVPLDFGVSALNTPRRQFLEIGVRPAGSTNAYTTLAPRQPLTDTPFAVFANRASRAAYADYADYADDSWLLGGIHYSQYVRTGDARLSDARTPTAGSSNYVQNTTTQQAGANFNISGNGTIGGNLTASTVNTGSDYPVVITGQSTSNAGTWLNLNNTSTGGGSWSLISSGSGNGEGAGNLLFYNQGTRMRLTTGGLHVFGTLTANAKNFQIDHPLDPANKVLNYTSIESPDMMNIYNGNITTNANGVATVKMPDYFEALNKDFRYQLTVIGTFAQAIVAEKMSGNTFKIRTDKPNVEVSWQVTGIRHDKFAEDKRAPVEENKPAADKGKCLYAPACGGKVQR